jgi:hypothetical protein
MRSLKLSRCVAKTAQVAVGLLLMVGCSQSGTGSGSTQNTSSSGGKTETAGSTSAGGSNSAGSSGGGASSGAGSSAATSSAAGGAAGGGGSTVKAGAVAGTTSVGGASAGKGGSTLSGGVASTGNGGSGGGGASAGGSTTAGGSAGTSATGTDKGGTTGAGGTATASSGAGGTTGGTGGTSAGGSNACPDLPAAPTGSTDAVAGNLIQYNDDGGWCWYQDERAVVDAKAKKLVIGSVGFKGSRVGNIEAVVYDMATGKASSPAKLGNIGVDDHSAPAMIVRPDGKYTAVWAGHRADCKTYYNIYDGSTWSAAKNFNWSTQGCPWDGDSTHMITYSNVWYMSSTDLFDIVRSVSTSQAILSSTDDGSNWSFLGRMTYTQTVGYVAGYYKYWGNNTDRIDFLGTEAHPRDNNNSLYHGYIKDGKTYNSAGTVVDSSLTDTTGKDITAYTQVFKTGTSLNGTSLCRLWNHDIVRYDDGTVAITGQGRTNNCTSTPSGSDPDKRFFYSRWDGQSWKTTYLVKSGPKLYGDEEDYTGLSALHPDNPNIIYVSSTYDPNDDKTTTPKHEIYQGVTCDKGATWKWVPVTKGSTMDNLRPIVPKWDADHTALLWMRGTYTTAQNMTMKIVGTITGL